MPIMVTCSCGKQFQTKDEYAGRPSRCPQCGQELIIPGAAASKLGQAEDYFAAGPVPGPPRTSGLAIASLVLGLLSFFCSVLTGLPAIILGVIGLTQIQKGRRTGQGMAIAGIVLGGLTTLLLPALLLPAVQAAREAARRSMCVNNLKQIGIALHNYHDTNGAFPPVATYDAAGKPLLSWRVLLLPYLEQKPLYDQFKLDEPWDSPNNKPLLAAMPQLFTCPSFAPAEPSTTTYQVLVGPGTLFEPGSTIKMTSVIDGTSNTLAVVESKTPVPWSSPADIPFVRGQPIAGAGSKHAGGFNALFTDASVRFLKNSISSQMLEQLATRNGGEVVDSSAY